MKKKYRIILLLALLLPLMLVLGIGLGVLAGMEAEAVSDPFDYDDPEDLLALAERMEKYIIRANPDRESPERIAALKALEDIALLDVSLDEKSRLIRERFPEESFWDEDMKNLLKAAESGDAEAHFQLGCYYLKDKTFRDDGFDCARGSCIIKSVPVATKWFRLAAMQGHVKAQNMLARRYLQGYHPAAKNRICMFRKREEQMERDIKEWMHKAIANKDFYVMVKWYDPEEDSECLIQRKNEGLDLAREAAEKGDASAMILLGHELYFEDEGDDWLRNAAELGNVDAMLNYANRCEYYARMNWSEGDDTDGEEKAEKEKENEETEQWRRKAFDTAEKRLDEGDTEDIAGLIASPSVMDDLDVYLDGEDKAVFAARICEKLCRLLEQHPESFDTFDVSDFFCTGLAKIAEADRVTLYRRFMDMGGHTFAREGMAHELLERDGSTPEDKAEAIRLLRVLSGFGYPYARLLLGKCCLNGDGVPQDNAEALKWLRLAADQGDDESMNLLRDHLWDSAPWNWPEAMKWSLRARMYPIYDSPSEYFRDELKREWNNFMRKCEFAWESLLRRLSL